MKTIFDPHTHEITEKRSRFIAALSPASTEEEAQAFIRGIKKKKHDASHNCSAYIIGEHSQISHSSDDGEPAGTAGKPMLAVLSANELYNVVAVVTRYFGGILLGTGGLVRAYSRALEECVAGANVKTMTLGARIKIEASYGDAGKLQRVFSDKGAVLLSSDYTDKVSFDLLVDAKHEPSLQSSIREATANRASLEIVERGRFAF